ncbi:MAG TPA: porphobilinogen synthase [Verrucomicrobia bacterium]|nr:porphobilinogen synthase [Verrucomicrobiota bacterium]
MNQYPDYRPRRLRRTAAIRRLFDTPLPGPSRFIWPVFAIPGTGRCEPITSMPGQSRYSPDRLVQALDAPVASGIGGILIFGVPDGAKDNEGHSAAAPDGIVPRTIKAVKKAYPDLPVFTDVCLCAYTQHGHCGPLDAAGQVDNDRANAVLARTAVAHAEAGADGVAPSAMMDGQVQAIRQTLFQAGLPNIILMSYSTKFASAFYGPFREAEASAPQSGDRRGYQASYANPRLALTESALDEAEGADILMVKPASLYLDVIASLRQRSDLPLAAYNVSGEYAMLCATAERGWGDLQSMVRESVSAIDRAGADLIISYWANRYDELIREHV